MRTYWFTVAVGPRYEEMFRDLDQSARMHGIEIERLGEGIESPDDAFEKKDFETFRKAKKLKIEGILNAPEGFERIVYVDSDMLIVDPAGIDDINGSLKSPWGIGNVPQVATEGGREAVERRERRLWKVLEKAGLEEFVPGGVSHRQEWNSGVIAGDRTFMMELAEEWSKWWDLVLDLFDGHFRRDQISYKFAYTLVARRKYGFETIPPDWNCVVKRVGFPRTAKILHKAGRPNKRIRRKWDKAKKRVFAGRYTTRWPLWWPFW